MKRIVLVSCFAALALGQQPGRISSGDWDITAMKISSEGSVMHMSGQVVIDMSGFTVHADEADFNQDSKEIHAHGDVSIKLK